MQAQPPVPIDLLPCLVSPEWTAVASSHIASLEASPCTASLWQEATLLEQLAYKNANQHRGTRPFQRLEEVRRLLRLAREADVGSSLGALRDALTLAARPTLSLHERRVPGAASAVAVLRRLLGFCRLTATLAERCVAAAHQFTSQLAQSFFMPLSLTCLAILARVRALSAQMLVDCVRSYNAVAELADLLPLPPTQQTDVSDLPPLLRVAWKASSPLLQEVSGGEDGIFSNEGSRMRPQIVGAAAAASGGGDVEMADAAEAAPPQLAVLEDRGVAISREQLAAELRLGAAAVTSDAPTAAAAVAEQVPEYARSGAVAALRPEESHEKGGLVLKKAKKPKKAPKIVVVDDESGDGGAARAPPPLPRPAAAVPKEPKVPAPQPSLPARTTAFIDVGSLQKKKKKKKESDGAAAAAAAAAAEPVAAPDAGAKSWEDWLAPIGGASAATGPAASLGGGSGGSGGGKKRRRNK